MTLLPDLLKVLLRQSGVFGRLAATSQLQGKQAIAQTSEQNRGWYCPSTSMSLASWGDSMPNPHLSCHSLAKSHVHFDAFSSQDATHINMSVVMQT